MTRARSHLLRSALWTLSICAVGLSGCGSSASSVDSPVASATTVAPQATPTGTPTTSSGTASPKGASSLPANQAPATLTTTMKSELGYQAELTLDLGVPVIKLGDPGEITVFASEDTVTAQNTTEGERPSELNGDIRVDSYWPLSGELAGFAQSEAQCTAPMLMVPETFVADRLRLTSATATELERIGSESFFVDANGRKCTDASGIPENLKPEVIATIAKPPTTVIVGEIGHLNFGKPFAVGSGGDDEFLAFCSASAQVIAVFDGTTGRELTFPEANALGYGECSKAGASPGAG